jgi:cytochrome c556
MKRLATLALAATLTALTLPAQAQWNKPEDAIKYRKSTMVLLANHFGRLGAMAQGRVPYDAKAAADNAALVTALAPLAWPAFGAGTDAGDTRARPEVWSDAAKFKAASDKFLGEVAKLDAAAKAGTLDALKPAVGAIGSTCKGCHDDFQKK